VLSRLPDTEVRFVAKNAGPVVAEGEGPPAEPPHREDGGDGPDAPGEDVRGQGEREDAVSARGEGSKGSWHGHALMV
jgi:hypothetical protein